MNTNTEQLADEILADHDPTEPCSCDYATDTGPTYCARCIAEARGRRLEEANDQLADTKKRADTYREQLLEACQAADEDGERPDPKNEDDCFAYLAENIRDLLSEAANSTAEAEAESAALRTHLLLFLEHAENPANPRPSKQDQAEARRLLEEGM